MGGNLVTAGACQCNVDQLGIAWRPSLRPHDNSRATVDHKLAAAVSAINKKQPMAMALKLHMVNGGGHPLLLACHCRCYFVLFYRTRRNDLVASAPRSETCR